MYSNVNKSEMGVSMKYVTYYEESEILNKTKFRTLKQELLTGKEENNFEEYTLRKLQFLGNAEQEFMPKYFICMRDHDEEQIYLEKKYIRDNVFHKENRELTKTECESILNGEIEWMKDHKEKILAEFYLQIMLNHLSPGYLTEQKREVIHYKKDRSITFSTSIKRAIGRTNDIFKEPEVFISCLDEERVKASYKKAVRIPDMIMNMLQGQEEIAKNYVLAI